MGSEPTTRTTPLARTTVALVAGYVVAGPRHCRKDCRADVTSCLALG
jgi:hypothetical protein